MLNLRLSKLISWVITTLLLRLALFLQLTAQTKPGCPSSCGDLNIPYPFGTTDGGTDCYYDTGNRQVYEIFCDNSTDPPVPYWPGKKANPITVADISVVNHEIRMNMYTARDCYNSSGLNTWRNSPWLRLPIFSISSTKNRFTAVGCDTVATFSGTQTNRFAIGCVALCDNIQEVTDGVCLGVGCCQASLPRDMWAYNITLGSYYNHTSVYSFNPCSYAFVAATDYFNFSIASLKNISGDTMPVVLDWDVGNQTCEDAQVDMATYMCKEYTNCTDSDSELGYRCHCKDGYQGNPYLSGPYGCQDINECEPINPCNGTCTNLPGSFNCSCPVGYEGDPSKDGCLPIHNPKKTTTRDAVLGGGIGFLILLLCSSWLILGLKQRRAAAERKKFYRDNGGLVLERLISQRRSNIETLKVFSVEDLKKATANFDETRILGEGGQGTVYKGVINRKTVAIKKAKMLDRSQVDEFINEVIVLSQINHKNVVKLIGCCLETELPLLVYEFVTNGTLSQHIHGNAVHSALSTWKARVRVAAETAGALSYIHSDATIPIIHRDVKTTNILLDENYTAKVSDFGASRLMPSDQTQLSTLVQGTLGYLDPEYLHTSQLTGKSDVYSFGVVLAELLTGIKPISFNKPEKDRYLSMLFVRAVAEKRFSEIIDKRILHDGNMEHIREVAVLACRCLKIRGADRPPMKEVALELEGLVRAKDLHPWVSQVSDNRRETEYLLGDDRMICGVPSPTGAAGYDSINVETQLAPFTIEEGR